MHPNGESDVLDLMYLLDRLEEALAAGAHVPLTARTLVDEQECLDILDQMRAAVPREMRQARRVLAERENLRQQTREEADQLIRDAEVRARRLVEEHALVHAARNRADQIEGEAEREALEIRAEAERYAGLVLARVSEQLEHALDEVKDGLRELDYGNIARR